MSSFIKLQLVELLTKQHKVKEEIVEAKANAIWDKSSNIGDCVKIARMAKSIEDVMFITDNLLINIAHPLDRVRTLPLLLVLRICCLILS